ncbi:hypothetical protein VIGAN_03244300 [Vigna angularis var. angularis]|uniref:Uncharacterized protein n=1 Tax=Vigna angularis var. angularis TaxID=157739 RepID=A0A0S3RP90_PHAAN|nr:hypothetical protein VIGAN_03244300 [Vigna angularis var. angularis]
MLRDVSQMHGVRSTAIASGATVVHPEDQIRSQTSDPHAQIADYFDIIVGAGICAILAIMLDEFHRISVTVARVRDERGGEVSEIHEKSLKVAAEVPAVAVVSVELH